MIPQKRGGSDCGDNLIPACKKCNSSKNDRDLLDWYFSKEKFPPILVLRRYLKLAYEDFSQKNFLKQQYTEIEEYTKLFRIDLLPKSFPKPIELHL